MSNLGYPFPPLVRSTGPAGTFTNEGPLLNGQPSPGQWLLVEAKREFGWEIRVGSYLTGAVVVPKGDPVMRIRYAVRIWASTDAGVYRQMLRSTLKKPLIQQTGQSTGIITLNTSAAALAIEDPSLADLGVRNVVVLSVTALYNPLVSSDGRGFWTAEVEFLEFRPPVAALPIPDQTIPDQGAVTPTAAAAKANEQAQLAQGARDREAAVVRSNL